MIVPMFKYAFLLYHRDYLHFLNELQQVGVLHIMPQSTEEYVEHPDNKSTLLLRVKEKIRFLEKRLSQPTQQLPLMSVKQLLDIIDQRQERLEALSLELNVAHSELLNAAPWGNFNPETIRKLTEADIHLRFFRVSKKKFTPQFQEQYGAVMVSENDLYLYFVIVQKGKSEITIDAKEVQPPEKSFSELQNHIRHIETKMANINQELDELAAEVIPQLQKGKDTIQSELDFEQALRNTQKKFDNRLMILEGWVPAPQKERIDAFLNEKQIVCVVQKATPRDRAPILLQNNRFSRLFEPIGKLFSLPSYAELDLTVFFAPFFMLFFGFCLGDAGYGLIFIVAASLYKIKAAKNIRPYLTLIQFLGIATVLLGIVSGTFFGINLIEANFRITASLKKIFLDPGGLLNLSIALGAAQIVFGMCIKAANQIRQHGWAYALGTFGWLFMIVGSGAYFLLTSMEIQTPDSRILTLILSIGGILVLLFTDPKTGLISRVGQGVWNIYSTVTGVFGDLLSYIRLFALGLSSAILGFVINEIALEMLKISPIIGPVFFIIFLILGHTMNILISSLSSFVHPMRLTFVEFFKNAGFTGGGKPYKPFSNHPSG